MTLLAPAEEGSAAPIAGPAAGPPGLGGRARRYPLLVIYVGAGASVGFLASLASGASSPALGLAGGVAAGLGYLAVVEPVVALGVLLAVGWSNLTNVVSHHDGLSAYFVALAIGVTSLVIGVRRSGTSPLPRTPIYLLLFAAVAANGLSLIATGYRVASLSAPTQRIKDVAFFFVLLGLLRLTGRWGTAVRVMVLTMAVLAGLTVIQQYILHNSTTFGGLATLPNAIGVGAATARHAGPEGDPNFWGRDIVLVTAPAMALLTISLRAGRRRSAIGWSIALLTLLVGEYLTQSRGDLLAMLALLLLWLVIVSWRHRKLLVLIPVGLVIVVLVVPGLGSRLSTLSELSNPSSSSTDPSLVGRLQAQEVGLAEFRSSPLFGVGFGNFAAVEPSFLGRPGIIDTGTVVEPHDLYTEILAEGGILGMGAWVLLYGGALMISMRAVLLARRLRSDPDELLALGCFVALVGWAMASIVLHLNYFENLLAVMAVATAIDAHVRDRAKVELVGSHDIEAPVPRRIPLGAGRLLVTIGVTALGVAFVAGIALVVPPFTTTYEATATASVRPVGSSETADNNYAWGTVSRATLLPTLAAISVNRRFVGQAEQDLRLTTSQTKSLSISAVGDLDDLVLSVRVVAARPGVATAVAEQTLERSRTYLDGLLAIYEVEPLSHGSVVPHHSPRLSVLVVLALLAVGALAGGPRLARSLLRRLT